MLRAVLGSTTDDCVAACSHEVAKSHPVGRLGRWYGTYMYSLEFISERVSAHCGHRGHAGCSSLHIATVRKQVEVVVRFRDERLNRLVHCR